MDTETGNSTVVDDLLLASAYAARAGVKLDDATYPVLDQLSRGETGINFGAVYVLLGGAVERIRPVTLEQLRSGFDPTVASSRRKGTILKRGLLVIAISVVATLMWATNHARHLESMAVMAKQFDDYQIARKRQLLARQTVSASLTDPRSSEFMLWADSVADLKAMSDRMQAETAAILDADKGGFENLIGWWNSLGSRRAVLPQAGTLQRTGSPPTAADTAAAAPGLPGEDIACNRIDVASLDDDLKSWAEAWRKTCVLEWRFASITKIYPGDNSFALQISKMRESLDFYYCWIFPLLYGALGSIVYLYRTVGDVRTPAPSVADSLLRIGMGSIFGLAVGWFAGSASSGEIHARLGVLPLAFLVGFSTDLLFRLLDKLIGSTQGLFSVDGPAAGKARSAG